MDSSVQFIPLATLLLVALLFHFLPRFWRPGLFFGVRVEPRFRESDEARHTLRLYRVRVWAFSAAALAVTALGLRKESAAPMMAGVAVQIAGVLSGFVAGQRRARPHAVPLPPSQAAEPLPAAAPRLPGGWPTALAPLAVLLAAALYLNAHWDQIPERFPIHWDVKGRPNGWALKSFFGVYGPLLIGAVVVAVQVVIALVIVHGPPATAGSRQSRLRGAVVRLLVAMMYSMASLFGYIALSSTGMIPRLPVWLPVVAMFAVIAMFAWPTLRISREPEDGPGEAAPDECWKFGDIYYNPNDPALMVERRFGIGYTFNFANKWAWVILAFALCAPVLIAILVRTGVGR